MKALLSPGAPPVAFLVCALWLWLRPQSLAARRTTIAAAVFFFLVSTYVVPYAIGAALLTRGIAPFDPAALGGVHAPTAVVVLGGGGERIQGRGDALSLMSSGEASRVLEAARVFKAASADWVISSGGADPSDVPVDEPRSVVMRDALMELGVPANRILLESDSKNTRDEAVLIAPMLQQRAVQHTILVTSAIHMRRSIGTFRAAGITVIPAPADDPGVFTSIVERWLPSGRGIHFTSEVLHELVGLAYYRSRGWWTR